MNEFICVPKEEYIAHHGILGMKWGRHNGPPYPLARTAKGDISSEQEARKKASKSSYASLYRKKKAADLQKKNAKIRAKNEKLEEVKREKKAIEREKSRNAELKNRQKQLKEDIRGKAKKPEKETKVDKKEEGIEVKTSDDKTIVIKNRPLTKKELSTMSDSEIRAYIDRLNLEKQLKNVDNEMRLNGQSEVKRILKNSAKNAGERVLTSTLEGAGKYMVKKLIGSVTNDDVAAEIMGGKKKGDDQGEGKKKK